MKFKLHWPEGIRHLIALAISWLIFSLLIGLFQYFKILESSIDQLQSLAIVEGLKISGITFFIGVIVISSVPAILSFNKKREP